MERIVSEYEVREIYHLAALLSTRAEFAPETAHEVNVQGTLGLLELALEQSSWRGEPVKFLFPSSIAVYGLPDLPTKERAGKVKEYEWTAPTTMYGCNKLYCEQLGRYFAEYYRQLAAEVDSRRVDFRCIRFPGIISAVTVPRGGTSDFAPEMIHAAAQNTPYACFVREDTIIPFMVMPDAIRALLDLAGADPARLRRKVYNVTSFSLTAGEIRDRVLMAFPGADISFEPDLKRQAIVDTWPLDVDDGPARRDWGWKPAFELDGSFQDYLVPEIRKRYEGPRT
jgi:nucleoside-diphosphate-sugar epimerase